MYIINHIWFIVLNIMQMPIDKYCIMKSGGTNEKDD